MRLWYRSPVVVTSCALILSAALLPSRAARAQTNTTSESRAAHLGSELGQPMPQETAVIPGPLRSFLRMAGISQEIGPPDVLSMLARNVSVWGYENGRETEFLRLIVRYVHMARELRRIAGPDGNLHVANCTEAVRLVHVLGYEFQKPCGQKDSYLATSDAGRAFLTVDSGFPLTQLEQDVQNGTPFSYAFPATVVPVLASTRVWASISTRGRRAGGDMLDVLLNDPEVDRLYSALARVDSQTAARLAMAPGLGKLLTVADIFDFYGSQICIRSGAVRVPGGPGAEAAWRELVDASPKSPGTFVERLLNRDQGWLAAYFDALSRVDPDEQAHLTQMPRLRQMYEAWRNAGNKTGAAEGVFPRNADLVLLFTRLRWTQSGEPIIPGDAADWREAFVRQTDEKTLRDIGKRQSDWTSSEKLLDRLVVASNVETDSGPLQLYLTLDAVDRGRPQGQPISDAAVHLLAANFVQYKDWYQLFGEFPELNDASITNFIQTANEVNGVSNATLRANALGAFQADIAIWEILARQGQIPTRDLNTSWQALVAPFSKITTDTELFDAARNSLHAAVVAAGGSPDLSQGEVVDLLAGPPQKSEIGRRVHEQLADRISSVLDDQRLVSLDSLFGLFDGLKELAQGQKVGSSLLSMAGDLREFELPRPIFTGSERTSWSPVVYSSRHAELQVRTDLTKVIRTPGSAQQLELARGRLAPFLRDTLVGLVYAYYEPPGAQVLRNNPLFVRAHDFSAASVQGVKDIWGAPVPVGVGVTAGGGAFLMGSLADLPYALAYMEEDFIAPSHVQALIWKETVPVLLTDSVVPRWWNVSHDELHAAALYQRSGEELLNAAAGNPQLREKVEEILAGCMTTRRLERVETALQSEKSMSEFLPRVLPTESFYLAAEFHKKFPGDAAGVGDANRSLDDLARTDPAATSMSRLMKDFGVPHPEIAQSDEPTLLFTGMFPISGGYANRLFGESWESTNLYWARIADEMGYSPAMLNIVVPALTRRMVSNIFGTSIDDWPALLRAMRQTGQQFREGKIDVGGTRLLAER
jgi:hypothetical protein